MVTRETQTNMALVSLHCRVIFSVLIDAQAVKLPLCPIATTFLLGAAAGGYVFK